MDLFFAAREEGAVRLLVIADHDDVVEPPALEDVDALRVMAADIDIDLGHGLDGRGMDPRRRRPAAHGLEPVAIEGVDQAFGHLGPGRIVDADEEDRLFHVPSAREGVSQTRPRTLSRTQVLKLPGVGLGLAGAARCGP